MLLDTKKLRSIRCYSDDLLNKYNFSKEGMKKYSFYGKTLDYSPEMIFATEYLYLRDNLKVEDTMYYNYLKNLYDLPNKEEIARTNCYNFIENIKSLEKHGQANPIMVFEVTDNVYIVVDGVHRSVYNYLMGQKIEAVYHGYIRYYWEVSLEYQKKILELYEKGWIYLNSDNMSYQPLWWITSKDNPMFIRRNTFNRTNVILEDIVDVQGTKVLDIGANSGHFSSAISQIQHMKVTAMDINGHWCELMKLRQETTDDAKWDVKCCALKDIDEEFDVVLYLDIFHELLRATGDEKIQNIKRVEQEFEQICKMAKHRIYFALGDHYLLKDTGHMSQFAYEMLTKNGFSVRMLHYENFCYPEYKRALYIAEK